MLTIYGASDDLIEVEGDINEEFNVCDFDQGEEALYVLCSDGAAWRVRYDEQGCWRFTPVVEIPDGWTKTEATDPDGDYTDRLECKHAIAWVALAPYFQKRTRVIEETDGQNPEETRG